MDMASMVLRGEGEEETEREVSMFPCMSSLWLDTLKRPYNIVTDTFTWYVDTPKRMYINWEKVGYPYKM
ncbi:hypothetical protein FH972_006151 [Carpinus fangiana]|uniref:Uncharacterized protein n=1 Tax=Carpinus fangiana TaxID=176857 RepID=A0A5N6QTS6_9ROSI|nr:hypothetical protein FH972_006151 [Carpinus fangiana]